MACTDLPGAQTDPEHEKEMTIHMLLYNAWTFNESQRNLLQNDSVKAQVSNWQEAGSHGHLATWPLDQDLAEDGNINLVRGECNQEVAYWSRI